MPDSEGKMVKKTLHGKQGYDLRERLRLLSHFLVSVKLLYPVFPLVRNQEFEDIGKDISKSLTAAGISHKMDANGTSIGKRYARTDELDVLRSRWTLHPR
ncbi:hypothetical protein ACLB2K_054266 [Fragaria x ananassa]